MNGKKIEKKLVSMKLLKDKKKNKLLLKWQNFLQAQR